MMNNSLKVVQVLLSFELRQPDMEHMLDTTMLQGL